MQLGHNNLKVGYTNITIWMGQTESCTQFTLQLFTHNISLIVVSLRITCTKYWVKGTCMHLFYTSQIQNIHAIHVLCHVHVQLHVTGQNSQVIGIYSIMAYQTLISVALHGFLLLFGTRLMSTALQHQSLTGRFTAHSYFQSTACTFCSDVKLQELNYPKETC